MGHVVDVSELEQIGRTVALAVQQRRRRRAVTGACHGILAGSLVLLAVLMLFKLFPLPEWSLVAAGGALPVGALLGAMVGWLRRVQPLAAARWLDERLELNERLSTALELGHQTTPWARLVAQDAARHAAGIEPRNLLPLQLAPAARWSLLSLGLAAVLGLVPEYRSAEQARAALERENIAETGQRLVQIVKHQLKANPPALEPTVQALEAVAGLGSQWNKNPPTRQEALQEAARLLNELEKQASELEKNPALKRLERAAREELSQGRADPQELQKKIADLESKLKDAAGQGAKLDELRQKMQQARAAAQKAAGQDGPEAEAARQQLAAALAALQKDLQEMGHNAQGLEEAIKALAEGKPGQMLKDLDLAMQDLDKLRDMAKALEKLQAARDQALGQNLGEQLQRGQAGAAIQTLERMARQLENGGATAEQQQQILQELTQALPPARDYGELAAKLQEAAQHLAQNRQAEAGQALRQAARELENMLAQMCDGEALAAAIAALARAEQAIAEGQCLGGMCQGQGLRQGKKPGGGVGTWADDSWLSENVERTELFDNSGVNRPDMDPRGLTDRPIQKPGNLEATKVQGKLASGTPLPSITLKGVSIKGTSSVPYEEAAAAAQAEAQNALNQDRVPRPYRQQVKEYFDDLK